MQPESPGLSAKDLNVSGSSAPGRTRVPVGLVPSSVRTSSRHGIPKPPGAVLLSPRYVLYRLDISGRAPQIHQSAVYTLRTAILPGAHEKRRRHRARGTRRGVTLVPSHTYAKIRVWNACTMAPDPFLFNLHLHPDRSVVAVRNGFAGLRGV